MVGRLASGFSWPIGLLLLAGCYRSFGLGDVATTDATVPDAVSLDARVDAGLPEAPCVPIVETCNGLDDDCDGRVDEDSCGRGERCDAGMCVCAAVCEGECVDPERDARHCGGCGRACEEGAGCAGGECCTLRPIKVDLLLVADDSDSMRSSVDMLRELVPALLHAIITGDATRDGRADFPPADLQVGVVTTDMGTGRVLSAFCNTPFGHDGVFRRSSYRDGVFACEEAPCFSTFDGDLDGFFREILRLAVVAPVGCEFEQALEAMLKALTPRASPIRFFDGTVGHGDGLHAGFLRPDSTLAVLVISDEDDCSAADTAVYDFLRDRTPPGMRCAVYGELLYSLERYVEGLLALRPPGRLHFGVLGGIPADLAGAAPDYDALATDPRMELVPAEGGENLRPICQTARGVVRPAPRLVELSRRLAARGASTSFGSLCESSVDASVEVLTTGLGRRLPAVCE